MQEPGRMATDIRQYQTVNSRRRDFPPEGTRRSKWVTSKVRSAESGMGAAILPATVFVGVGD